MIRQLLVAALFLAVDSAAYAADRPIPQDLARMEERARGRLEWNRKMLQGAYDRVGKKDVRWDKPAREALDLAARMYSQQVDPIVSPADVYVPVKKAIDAGCDDPLIAYLYSRTSVGPNSPNRAEFTRRVQAASDALAKSDYPAYRRASALMAAAEWKASERPLTPAARGEAERGFDAVIDLLGKSAAEGERNEFWEDRWFAMINDVIGWQRRLSGDSKAAFDRVDARLAKVPGIDALRLMVKGNFLLHWATEARTTAFAPAVGEQRMRTFEGRVREAKAAFEAVWKINPDEPHLAELMLSVEKSIGGGDREAMELWFERAMKADGNDQKAYWQKLDWLDPKWHGGDSPAEMIAFGKACRATKNWRTGITLLAAEAHYRYCSTLPGEQPNAYLRSSRNWLEIQAVYDEYLAHFPKDAVARSKYAMLCYYADHIVEAHEQFQILGDRLTMWPTFPYVPLEILKQYRDDAARIVARKSGRGGGGPGNPPK